MRDDQIAKISKQRRTETFHEVSCGFNEEQALDEAKRCLQCSTALCLKGCPAEVDIKSFIGYIQKKDYAAAIAKIKENNSLPAVCGRVCPQEEQCQFACVLNKTKKPIQIGYLERFVADWEYSQGCKPQTSNLKPKTGIKVAVIGSGPAGLTASADLAKAGFSVHLFEGLHKFGGVLAYGIPEFRLPKNIVDQEIEYIRSLGVILENNCLIGRTKTIADLRNEGFKAFFIAAGAGLPQFLNISGENSASVYSANEFLTRVNLMRGYDFPEYDTPIAIGKKTAVFGAGNVAFDCARCALRLGAKQVDIVYRRSYAEMPARLEEIENAREEGIIFNLLVSPLEILSNENGIVTGVRCIKNRLGNPDSSGRQLPIAIPKSEFILDADTVIIAVGTSANPLLTSTLDGIALTEKGYLRVNKRFQTSLPDVFAGGDIVSGSATVISAISHAKIAAKAITAYLRVLC